VDGKKLSRRDFLRMAGIAAGGTLLAACQPKATEAPAEAPAEKPKEEEPTPVPEKAEEVELVWLVRANERENKWEEDVAVPAFEEMYPNVKVNLTITAVPSGSDWVAKVMSMYAAGTPPDAHNGIVGTFIQLYAEEKVLDLTPYIDADAFDMAPFGALAKDPDMCRSGKQMAMPILTTAGCPVFYNMDLFDEAGLDYPPTDWKDES